MLNFTSFFALPVVYQPKKQHRIWHYITWNENTTTSAFKLFIQSSGKVTQQQYQNISIITITSSTNSILTVSLVLNIHTLHRSLYIIRWLVLNWYFWTKLNICVLLIFVYLLWWRITQQKTLLRLYVCLSVHIWKCVIWVQ